MSTLGTEDSRARAMHIISAVTNPARRFKELGDVTDVHAATWRSFWIREGAVPSGAMLEGLAKNWPQYAFWLLTGITDPEAGHVAPPSAADDLIEPDNEESPIANAYFQHQLARRSNRKERLDLSALEPDYEAIMKLMGPMAEPKSRTAKGAKIDLSVLDQPLDPIYEQKFNKAKALFHELKEQKYQDRLAELRSQKKAR
ncbi:hypothetical protein PI93_005610 [Pandoraea fibrosis]|uniref:XRE family transcriptional regulator n=1 Tax=Pandoraea fibrosis TaxID=1891094 RepID=A0ABX6HMS4_9BURK|nr:hypothetical protein [Pandoraea fibrosis]QHE94251.1 hypothetical protein PJ20_022385 [Pandoraea fibrosis]QHF12185.1 hypothetical protein PI93_005610 [Pandoraea fibrosis]